MTSDQLPGMAVGAYARLKAERAALDRVATIPDGYSDYYDGRLRLDADDVTQ
ncbi:MAG: hypothetical protein HYZ18_15925 [Pseudogulbenkiania sp.]|nr:hypothetical protein [Pseudogulbenkiania sp.]